MTTSTEESPGDNGINMHILSHEHVLWDIRLFKVLDLLIGELDAHAI
jgi:hypothetical protein